MITFPECPDIGLDATIPDDARHWRNQPEIFRWCRQHSLITESAHQTWLNSSAWSEKNKTFGIYQIGNSPWPDDPISKRIPIGVCALTNIDMIARHAEFSLYIEPCSQGKGYGLKALYAITRHGFECFNFNKIWGETFKGNPAQRLFTKLGYQKHPGHIQHYFKDGQYIDTYFYILLQKDFLNEPPPIFDQRSR